MCNFVKIEYTYRIYLTLKSEDVSLLKEWMNRL